MERQHSALSTQDSLRHRPNLHACVVMPQDAVVGPAAERHAVGADLTEADAVPPALPEERIAVHAVRIDGFLDDEEIVRDGERPANRQSFEREGTSSLGRDFELHDSLRRIDPEGPETVKLADR